MNHPPSPPRPSSRLAGFYELERSARLKALADFTRLPEEALAPLTEGAAFSILDAFVENAVGAFPLPLAIATNFQVDGRDVLIPMAVEESSVVAAASHSARMVREGGGFTSEVVSDLMIGQIQLIKVSDPAATASLLLADRPRILALANATQPMLRTLGGGCRDLEVRILDEEGETSPWVIVHLLVDVKDAMGANMVNTMCEAVAPHLEMLTGCQIGLRILSNLADRRVIRAHCRVPVAALHRDGLSGAEVRDRIVAASRFAEFDPYRAATHNKGVMNGVDPVVIATGNDWRAIEAGVHAYAARSGRYTSITRWCTDLQDGALTGVFEAPLQVGTVGGVTRLHPVASLCLRLLQVHSATELARVMACVGLAQNLAALRALATEGIQRGHMRMHAKNLALASGAEGPEVGELALRLVDSGDICPSRASELLREMRLQGGMPLRETPGSLFPSPSR